MPDGMKIFFAAEQPEIELHLITTEALNSSCAAADMLLLTCICM